MITDEIQRELQALGSIGKAADLARFFKTGPGEYGEGDRFLGVPVPGVRSVARRHYAEAGDEDLCRLLESDFHEVRLCGLLMLVERYERMGAKTLRTDRDGAIVFRTDGMHLSVSTYAAEKFLRD